MTTKHYYAIAYQSSYAVNDSDEKIKDWKTAQVYRFTSQAARDGYCGGEQLRRPISAKRAVRIGDICDYVEILTRL